MIRLIKGIASAVGIGARAFVALIGVAGITIAVANYTMTQGAGTNFGSIVVSTVHYAQQLLCDPTTPSQCAAVSSGGAVKVDGSAVTQPVSGTVTATPTGTQAISAASGQIASGAMAAGSHAAGAGVDGWDLTQGTKADTACAAPTSSTACSVIAGLKGIIDVANTPGQLKVNTTGGATPTGNIAANNTTAVVVKASAGTLYGVQLAGLGSAPAYLKIYNATSATCGSGTPVKRLMIPAASTAANGAGSNITFGPMGVAFGTGITYCITTGITDADTTAPAASTFLVNLDWN